MLFTVYCEGIRNGEERGNYSILVACRGAARMIGL